MRRDIELTWNTFEKRIVYLLEEVGDYRPDAIVGIVRGGVVPARVLCSKLEVETMYCLNVTKVGEDRRVTTDILDDLTGLSVLLVEDMIETGRSMEVAKNYLESKGADVKTACFYTMINSEISPDYDLGLTRKNIKFPWE